MGTDETRMVCACVLLSALLAFAVHAADEPVAKSEPVFKDEAGFAASLEALAGKCDSLGLAGEARVTRQWIVRREAGRQYFFVVAEQDPTQPADDAPTVVKQWHSHFRDLRRDYARVLWESALADAEARRPAAAYRKVHEVLREDPDHAEARRVLGYKRSGDRWQPSERIRTQSGRTLPPTVGWKRNECVRVDSPHFHITTDAQASVANAMAARLEVLHDVWRQLFFTAWSSPEQLQQVMRGKRQFPAPGARYEIVLFRDRDEYVRQLKQVEPQIDVTKGYYQKGTRTAFFYAGDDSPAATQYHEVTHQLFHGCTGASVDPGEHADFWIVEAMPLYMESFEPHNGYCTLGGPDSERLQYARARRLNENFYLALDQLVPLSRTSLQQHPDLRAIYTEIAGLAHFLMDSQDGQLRDAAIEYARRVNSGDVPADLLTRLAGKSFAELDAMYFEFMKTIPKQEATDGHG